MNDTIMAVTSISTCLAVGKILEQDATIATFGAAIFPVIAEKGATLPYIEYRRTGHEASPTKSGNADAATVEVVCYAQDYTGSVRMAEAVRAALDGAQYTSTDLAMRSSLFIGGEEYWTDDAYAQRMEFRVRVIGISDNA